MDKKHGWGRYQWSDGRVYDGLWRNGKQHGEGTYIQKDGSTRAGIWEDGKRTKWINEDETMEEKLGSHSPSPTEVPQ